jgi:hypothetical protein
MSKSISRSNELPRGARQLKRPHKSEKGAQKGEQKGEQKGSKKDNCEQP